jgi:hypothetical protein
VGIGNDHLDYYSGYYAEFNSGVNRFADEATIAKQELFALGI